MQTIDTLKLKINNIKNIKEAELEIPLEKSLNLIVGGNGSGKSTVLLALSQTILKHSLKTLKDGDYDNTSTVEIELNEKHDTWAAAKKWKVDSRQINLNGMYEGSLFYGTRFNDSKRVDELLSSGQIKPEDIVDADDYIKEKSAIPILPPSEPS